MPSSPGFSASGHLVRQVAPLGRPDLGRITIERRSFENGTAFTAVAPSERLGGLRLSIVRFENENTQRWFQANYALAKILQRSSGPSNRTSGSALRECGERRQHACG
jgi:hypothetical protein